MSVLARWKPIVAALALGVVAAVAYLVLTEERYEAEAKLQVVPLPAGDRTFAGFPLPRGAGAAETVADLVERPAVVDAAAVRLRLDREQVLDALSVRADQTSNVVTVRAEAGDPSQAAQVANAVADEFVAERSAVFQGELNRTIERLRDELRNVPASERAVPPADALVARLTSLRASLGEPDPTVRVAGNAVARDRAVGPRPLPVLAAGLLVSLVLGVAAAALLAAAGSRPSTAPTPDDRGVAKREAELAERVRVVTERERVLARRAGELAARERELERRATVPSAPPPRPEPVPEREPEPELEPEPEPPAAPGLAGGAWNLGVLERLVAERESEFPERVDEWRNYLFFLRQHASPDGALPPSFDALVDETFRELVG